MSIRSVTSALAVRAHLSAYAFAFGLRGGIFTTSIPAPDSTASNAAVNCPGPVPDQEPGPGGALPQIHQQVPCLLHRPGAVRVRGHAEDMHITGAGFDHEEHVEAAQGDCTVHVEEIARQHRGRLGAQELPPARAAALRRWRYPQPLQHPSYRGGADPDAQAGQLALDPLVAPARVLPRHLRNQRRELGIDRRPTASVGISPPPADGASATASAASLAGSPAADQGAAGPRRRIPPGPPSPASAWGSAAA